MAEKTDRKDPVEVKNPAYEGATPEQVGRALLRQKPEKEHKKSGDQEEPGAA